MKRIKKALTLTISLIVFAGCGLVSGFLLASGYESVYSKSLPFVHTIDPVDLTAFGKNYNLKAAAKQDVALYGNYGKPQAIKLPGNSLRLDVVPPLNDNGVWLARANTLQLLIPGKPREGNIGIALLYCRSSFRTISEQNLPRQGANIFMDTDRNWRYVYKVTSTSVTPEAQTYVLADDGATGRLVMSCNDSERNTNVVIEAVLLSVQGKDV